MTEDPLALEPERTIYDYSFAWDGEEEDVRDLGDAIVRSLPVRWFGVDGMSVWIRLGHERVDERIDALLEEVEGNDRRHLWLVGPSSTPSDLGERLEARGLEAAVVWDGMILDDLDQRFKTNPDVHVEPLSEDTAEDLAAMRAYGFDDARVREARLAAARHYLQIVDKQTLIYIARLNGQPAGFVQLRIEPNGVAYFRDAFTLPEFRKHGVYLALVAHRLRVARDAGCHAAAVQANQQTSSPILQKRGWRPTCIIKGYARKDPSSGYW